MKKQSLCGLAVLLSLLLVGGAAFLLSGLSTPLAEPADLEVKQTISLPSPRFQGDVSVEEAIFGRRSIRSYTDEPLTREEVGQVLWAAAGKTVDGITGATRAYPSAGGIYPLDVYLVAGNVDNLPAGVYRYDWREHSLELLMEGDQRGALRRAALGQGMIADAPANLVFTADVERTARRYGSRGEDRYVSMDLGGAGQNVHLQAEALGLGTVVVGAFTDSAVKSALGGVQGNPLYIMPLGRKP